MKKNFMSSKWPKSKNDDYDVQCKLSKLFKIVETIHPGFDRQFPGLHFFQNVSLNVCDRRGLGIDCDEVYPNIFIGDGGAAKSKNYLKFIGISHVINCAEGDKFTQINTSDHFYSSFNIKYMGLNLLDSPSTKISIHFAEAADFIENALKSGGRVLVHCLMGVSRSATIVIAYLMIKKLMTLEEALKVVRKKRPVRPNTGFFRQLIDLELKIKAGGGYLVIK